MARPPAGPPGDRRRLPARARAVGELRADRGPAALRRVPLPAGPPPAAAAAQGARRGARPTARARRLTVAAPRRASDGRLENRPSPRSPADPVAPGVHESGVGHGPEVLLAVPPDNPVPRPLLVFFHGAGGTAGQSLAAVGDLAGDAGAVVWGPWWAATPWA